MADEFAFDLELGSMRGMVDAGARMVGDIMTSGQRGIEQARAMVQSHRLSWEDILAGYEAIRAAFELRDKLRLNSGPFMAGMSWGLVKKLAVDDLDAGKRRLINALKSSMFLSFLSRPEFYEGVVDGLIGEFTELLDLAELVRSGEVLSMMAQALDELTGSPDRAFNFGMVLGEGVFGDVIDALEDEDYGATARAIGEYLGPLLLELFYALVTAGGALALQASKAFVLKLASEAPRLAIKLKASSKRALDAVMAARPPKQLVDEWIGQLATPSKASGVPSHSSSPWAPPGGKIDPPADFPKPDTPAALPHVSATTQPPAALTDPSPVAAPISKVDKGLADAPISRLSRGLEPAPLPTRRPELHELFATLAPDQWAGLQPWQARSVVATFDDVPKLTADAGTLRELIKIYRSWQPGRPEMNAIAATGELAILHRLARSKVVSKIRMIVSGSGQRTPDYDCVLADGTEITIEVRTLTGTGQVLQGSARPRVFDEAMSYERFLVEFPKTNATQDRIREAIRDKIRHDQIGAFNSQGYVALVVDQATDAGLLNAEFQDSIRQMLAGRPHILGVRILIGDTADAFIPIDNPSVSFNHPF